jgi:type IV secretion system protein VirB5
MSLIKRGKKFLASLALGLGISVGSMPAHAGIPVFDAGNFTDVVANIMRWLQQVQDWQQQLNQMQAQLTQAQTMTAKLDGARSLGSILNNPAIQSALPPELQNAASILMNPTGLTSSSAAISNLLSSYGITVPATGIAKGSQLADILLKNQSLLQSAQQRETQLTQLASRVDTAADAKESSDLVARNTIENGRIMNSLVQALAMQEVSRQQVELQVIAKGQATQAARAAALAALPR